MTSTRLLRSAVLAAVALAAGAALPRGGWVTPVRAAPTEDPVSPAQEEPEAVRRTRADLERAFLAAEADHVKVRARGLGDRLGTFPRTLARALGEAGISTLAADTAPPDGAVERVLSALPTEGRPLSDGSLRVVLGVLLAPHAGARALNEVTVRDEFVGAARSVFDAPRFEDVWDAKFLGLPEVRAWRAAVAAAAAARTPEPPVVPPAPAPPAPGPEEPGPPVPAAPTIPPQPATPTAPVTTLPVTTLPPLPPPDAPDPLVNLVPVDRSRGWVGPWRGWIADLPDRENRRQRRPARPVWIDRYEVTCAQYLRFLLTIDAGRRRELLPVGWTLSEDLVPAHPEGRGRTPVTGVTYFQAQEYAQSQGKRLPTEDEWERAAGGGEKDARAFPWGPDAGDATWAYGGAADAPVAVDQFPGDRTPDDIVGLAGNVAELVATLGDRHDVPAKVSPSASIVIRGGSWRTARAGDCGTDFRWVIDAGQTAAHVGFRCVMDEAEYRKRTR